MMIQKQGPYLIVTMRENLTDTDLLELRNTLVTRVGALRSRALIIDVQSLDIMDSFSCRTMRDIAHMVRLRGAETVIVGIQPEVALTMVQLGLTLEGIVTALDLEEGLEYLDHRHSAAKKGKRSRAR